MASGNHCEARRTALPAFGMKAGPMGSGLSSRAVDLGFEGCRAISAGIHQGRSQRRQRVIEVVTSDFRAGHAARMALRGVEILCLLSCAGGRRIAIRIVTGVTSGVLGWYAIVTIFSAWTDQFLPHRKRGVPSRFLFGIHESAGGFSYRLGALFPIATASVAPAHARRPNAHPRRLMLGTRRARLLRSVMPATLLPLCRMG